MVTLLLADDHDALRTSVRGLLEDEPDIEVVGEARDGREAVSMADTLKPDILLTDLRMPHLDGIAVTEYVSRSSPGTRVIVLSIVAEREYVARALAAGARGYVVKRSGIDDLVPAIRAVAAGRRFLSPHLGDLFGQ
jgi:DNA-binding NarL/FixJ family response regulator